MKWINVKDRPAPIRQRIAVRAINEWMRSYAFYSFGEFSEYKSWYPDGVSGYEWEADFDLKDVTHWAEIEEPDDVESPN